MPLTAQLVYDNKLHFSGFMCDCRAEKERKINSEGEPGGDVTRLVGFYLNRRRSLHDVNGLDCPVLCAKKAVQRRSFGSFCEFIVPLIMEN
jgi:hypothetical protein